MGALLAALAGGVIWAFGFEVSLHRWQEFLGNFSSNPRYLVDEIIVRRILGTSGWWGFGAGTFRITFPFFTKPWGDRVGGVWEYAHEDYLQTLVEWGFIGAALWAALFLGGWVTAAARHARHGAVWPESTRLFSLGCLLSLAGVGLHALVDFPLQIASLALYAAVVLAFLWSHGGYGRPRRNTATAARRETIIRRIPSDGAVPEDCARRIRRTRRQRRKRQLQVAQK